MTAFPPVDATFVDQFFSPHETVGERFASELNGKPFTVLAVIDQADAEHDEEVLPMYRIRFDDGYEVDAWSATSSITAREAVLIRRIETAPDFGYDDEQVELNESLARRGLAWRWTRGGNERVEVYAP